MNKFILGAAALTMFAAACNKDAQIASNEQKSSSLANAKTTYSGFDTLGGVINTGDTVRLSSDILHYLNAKLYVKGVLIIEAGTRIEGIKKSTPQQATAIIVCRNGKIYANGTVNKPIIMSANTYPNATPGDWGGVVLIGNGVTNRATATAIEGIDQPTLPAGVTTADISYGGPTGNVVNDNSGRFQYVRIEYAGAAIAANNELNAFTAGGVGNATVVDHVMSSLGADDGFEFFGGNFNPSYLVSFACNDDQFDFDHGFRGRIQFALGYIVPTLPTGYSADPNGIESDNDGTGTAATPLTLPNISNLTLVGTQTEALNTQAGILYGARFRRGSAYLLRNSLIMGYKTGINLDPPASGNPTNDTSALRAKSISYTVFSTFTKAINGNKVAPGSGNKYYDVDSMATVGNFVANSNRYSASSTGVFLANPFPAGVNALVAGLEPVSTAVKAGANFTGTLGFQTVTFKGAVGNLSDNWLIENWVDFTP